MDLILSEMKEMKNDCKKDEEKIQMMENKISVKQTLVQQQRFLEVMDKRETVKNMIIIVIPETSSLLGKSSDHGQNIYAVRDMWSER